MDTGLLDSLKEGMEGMGEFDDISISDATQTIRDSMNKNTSVMNKTFTQQNSSSNDNSRFSDPMLNNRARVRAQNKKLYDSNNT